MISWTVFADIHSKKIWMILVSASIFFTLLFASMQIADYLLEAASSERKINFGNEIALTKNRIADHVAFHNQILYSIRSAFQIKLTPITESQWQRFVMPQYELIVRFGGHDKNLHILYLENQTSTGRYPVKFIFPQNHNASLIQTLDLASDPPTLQAMENARDNNRIESAGPTRLSPDFSALISLLPIYKNGTSPNTTEEKRAEIIGYAVITASPEHIFGNPDSNADSEIISAIGLDVADKPFAPNISGQNMAYQSHKVFSPESFYVPEFTATTAITIDGKEWFLRFFTLPATMSAFRKTTLPIMTFFGGFLISLLFGVATFMLLNTRNRALVLAKSMTADLQNFQFAVDNASDHIIITDSNGKIIFANKGMQRITGYSRAEVLGKTPAVWGAQMPDAYYKNLWHTIYEAKKPFLGKITNKRKSGEIYAAELGITPILDKNGEIKFFVGIERDITEEEEIDKSKSEFVSVASHQLRTPISAINWYTEMLLGGDVGSITDKQRDYLNEVYRSSKRMAELVGALLNVSRIELGTFAMEPKQIRMDESVKSIVEEIQLEIKAKKLNIVCTCGYDLPVINMDPNVLRIVLQNIISNSVKYTPENGSINVGLSKNDNNVLIEISDNGYGIPLNQQDKIFTKFFRADNVREKDTDGTGLGLYIAKELIKKAGGKIWFKSAENRGTTFWISIPINNELKLG